MCTSAISSWSASFYYVPFSLLPDVSLNKVSVEMHPTSVTVSHLQTQDTTQWCHFVMCCPVTLQVGYIYSQLSTGNGIEAFYLTRPAGVSSLYYWRNWIKFSLFLGCWSYFQVWDNTQSRAQADIGAAIPGQRWLLLDYNTICTYVCCPQNLNSIKY